EVDERPFAQRFAQAVAALDRSVEHDLLGCVTDRERQTILEIRDDFGPDTPLLHEREQPGQRIGLIRIGHNRLRPTGAQGPTKTLDKLFENRMVDDECGRWRPLLLDSRLQHHDPSPQDDESGIDRTEPLRCAAFRPPLSLNRPTSSSSSIDISIRGSERWLKPRLHFVCLYSNIKIDNRWDRIERICVNPLSAPGTERYP